MIIDYNILQLNRYTLKLLILENFKKGNKDLKRGTNKKANLKIHRTWTVRGD